MSTEQPLNQLALEQLALLRRLRELRVGFCVSVPSQWGAETMFASPEDLLLLIEDPPSVYAKHYGVTKMEFLAWQADGYSVRCAAKTLRGKPCKHAVTGGANVSPQIWKAMQGQYCSIHGDGPL